MVIAYPRIFLVALLFAALTAKAECVRDMDNPATEARCRLDAELAARRGDGWWRWFSRQVHPAGWLALEAGRDSNINSATDRTVVDVPYLNYRSLTLSPVLIAQPSDFLGANGGLRLSYPYSPTLIFRLRGQGAIRYNASQVGYLPHGYHLSASAEKWLGPVGLAIDLSSNERWIAGHQLVSRAGQRASAMLFPGAGFRLSVTAGISENRYPLFNAVETTEDNYGLGLEHRSTGIQLSLLQGRERSQGTVKDLDRRFQGYAIGWSRAIGAASRIDVRYGETRHDYDLYSTLFLTRRTDTTRELSVSYEHRLGNGWSLSPKYFLERNDTPIPLLQFNRRQWLIELRKEF